MKRILTGVALLLGLGVVIAETRFIWYSPTLTGVNDNDVLLEMTYATHGFMSGCDTWEVSSTAGAIDVFVSKDGTNYLATAVALVDRNSTTPSTAVVVTTAGGLYGLRGYFKKIKFLQNGATAVANGVVSCGQM